MQYSPWISKRLLNSALRFTTGQIPEGDTRAKEVARFLDRFELSDDVRKDKQFRANVSLQSDCPFLTLCSYGYV